jgi:hypothetical protein
MRPYFVHCLLVKEKKIMSSMYKIQSVLHLTNRQMTLFLIFGEFCFDAARFCPMPALKVYALTFSRQSMHLIAHYQLFSPPTSIPHGPTRTKRSSKHKNPRLKSSNGDDDKVPIPGSPKAAAVRSSFARSAALSSTFYSAG